MSRQLGGLSKATRAGDSAVRSSANVQTATGINERGQIVGYYLDGSDAGQIGGSTPTTKMAPITLSSPRPSAAFPAPSSVLACPA